MNVRVSNIVRELLKDKEARRTFYRLAFNGGGKMEFRGKTYIVKSSA